MSDSGVFKVTRRIELTSKLLPVIAVNPNQSCLDLLDSFPDLSVKAVLATKHVFFTGDTGDAQELECADDVYRAGYKLYRSESISAKAPWANGWERETG